MIADYTQLEDFFCHVLMNQSNIFNGLFGYLIKGDRLPLMFS